MTRILQASNSTQIEKLRLVIYLRVSTDEQSRSGYGLDRQIRAVIEYAERIGAQLVGDQYLDLWTGLPVVEQDGIWVFRFPEMIDKYKISIQHEIGPTPGYMDDYTGTVAPETRPEGQKVFAILRAGGADGFIVEEMSRLVRPKDEGDEWDIVPLLRGLSKLDKEIHCANDGRIGTSFMELMMAVFKAKEAGDARRDTLHKTWVARLDKVRVHKKVVGSGRCARYGYRYVYDDQGRVCGYEISEGEAKIVRLIYHWYVYGDGDKKWLSVAEIVEKLRKMATPTPTQCAEIKTRNGKEWSRQTVRHILRQRIYIGEYRFASATHNKVPPIIDRDLFDKAQKIIALHARLLSNNSKHQYLLTKRILCTCGRHLVGHTRTDGSQSYYCTNAARKEDRQEGICNQRAVNAKAFEIIIWDSLKEAYRDLGRLENLFRKAQGEQIERSQPLRDQLRTVEDSLADADEQVKALAEGYARGNKRVREQFDQLQQQLDDQIEHLEKRKAELEEQLADDELSDEIIETVMDFCRDVQHGLRENDFDLRRLLLDILKVEIKLDAEDGYALTSLITGWHGALPRFDNHARVLNPEAIPTWCSSHPYFDRFSARGLPATEGATPANASRLGEVSDREISGASLRQRAAL